MYEAISDWPSVTDRDNFIVSGRGANWERARKIGRRATRRFPAADCMRSRTNLPIRDEEVYAFRQMLH